MPNLYNHDTYEKFERTQREMAERATQKALAKERYDSEVLETLKRIEQNTGDIAQIIALLQDNTVNQEKVLSLLSEINSIGVSKSEDDADGKYREIMKKVSQLEEDITAVDTLMGYGKMVWYGVKAYLKTKGHEGTE